MLLISGSRSGHAGAIQQRRAQGVRLKIVLNDRTIGIKRRMQSWIIGRRRERIGIDRLQNDAGGQIAARRQQNNLLLDRWRPSGTGVACAMRHPAQPGCGQLGTQTHTGATTSNLSNSTQANQVVQQSCVFRVIGEVGGHAEHVAGLPIGTHLEEG